MAPVLYYCTPSPPSRAAVLAARAVGVDVTMKEINLLEKEHLKPEFIKINPQHTIPTMTDGDLLVVDSHAIAAYLVDQYAADDSLYPKNPKERALVDQRMYFDAGTLFPRLRGVCFPVLFLGKTTIDEEQKKAVYEALDFLDKFLEGKKWVAGNKMTIADFSVVTEVSTFKEIGFNLSQYKNVKAWLDLCEKEIPGYEELNGVGAKMLGQLVQSKIEPNQL